MPEDYLKTILHSVDEAGKTALKQIEKNQPQLKGDHSVITEADQEVSRLVRERLSAYLKNKDHILIDEESPDNFRFLNRELLKKTPYIWSIDPIDGTRLYANKIPIFSISFGLIKNLEPWLGAVYFPALQELFYCDGEEAFFVEGAFTGKQKTVKIRPLDPTISYFSILMCDDETLKNFHWDYKDCQIVVSGCASADLCWPTIGRGCGAVFKSSLWDMAGSWPIVHQAGFKLRSISTGQVLDKLEVESFNDRQKPWRVKDFYIVSSERNFPIIQKKLVMNSLSLRETI